MNTYIWYSNSTSTTGRLLGQVLDVPCGARVPPEGTELTICWGARLPKKLKRSTVVRLQDMSYINSVYAIEKNANKYFATNILWSGHCNVPSVCRPHSVRNALQNGAVRFPLIGRKFYHQGGQNLKICLHERDLNGNSDYYVQFIPNRAEYRVHVYRGKVIRVGRKVLSESDECFSPWIKSRSQGWRLHYLTKSERYRLPDGLKRASIDAVECMCLDFGGVDVVEGEDGKFYILEINTGMGLDEVGLRVYGKRFLREIEEQSQ